MPQGRQFATSTIRSNHILVNERYIISKILLGIRRLIIPLSVIALMVVNVVTLNKLNIQNTQIESQKASIIKTKTELKTTSESLKLVEGEKTTIDASLKQEREKSQGLEQENQSLKVNLQAKKEREAQQAEAVRLAAETPTVAAVAPPSGNCSTWLAQAGVADVANAQELISRESGCTPQAVNPSSGACGIGQQLPCGKWEHTWNDPVGSIIDMQKYVIGRYGSWANAVSWHVQHGWY